MINLVHSSAWEEEDKMTGRSRSAVTMEAMRQAADSVLPWLGFTVDYPDIHETRTVPMLDLQVWARHPDLEDDVNGDASDVLAWSFYEKPTSSDKVLRATSAYNWRSKLVTMNMELWRRMHNCTRQITAEARTSIVCKFVQKLRSSGHAEATVSGIITSEMGFYARKLIIDLSGRPTSKSEE